MLQGFYSYKVVYSSGTVIREGIDLESAVVCEIPCGESINVQDSSSQTNTANIRRVRAKWSGFEGWTSISARDGTKILERCDEYCLYKVVYENGTAIRAGLELHSEKVSDVPFGEFIDIQNTSSTTNSENIDRVRAKWNGIEGWTSIFARDGTKILDLCDFGKGNPVGRVGEQRKKAGATDTFHSSSGLFVAKTRSLREDLTSGSARTYRIFAENAQEGEPPHATHTLTEEAGCCPILLKDCRPFKMVLTDDATGQKVATYERQWCGHGLSNLCCCFECFCCPGTIDVTNSVGSHVAHVNSYTPSPCLCCCCCSAWRYRIYAPGDSGAMSCLDTCMATPKYTTLFSGEFGNPEYTVYPSNASNREESASRGTIMDHRMKLRFDLAFKDGEHCDDTLRYGLLAVMIEMDNSHENTDVRIKNPQSADSKQSTTPQNKPLLSEPLIN